MPKRSKRKKPASNVRRSAASLEAEATKQTIVAAGLAQQTERLSVEFIETELEMGLTFAQAAQSYRDPRRRKQATDRPGLRRERKRIGTEREWFYQFPGLDICRDHFDQITNSKNRWPRDDDDEIP
jgi:hypothetical protein